MPGKKTARKAARKPSARASAAAKPGKGPFVKAKHAGSLAPKKLRDGSKDMAAPRSDLNQPGHVAIDRFPEPHRTIARAADAAIKRIAPDAESIVKWGNACYYCKGRAFATLCETKAGINLALPGVGIDDPHKLLEGTGKTMRHVKLRDAALASDKRVADLIRAALAVGFDRM